MMKRKKRDARGRNKKKKKKKKNTEQFINKQMNHGLIELDRHVFPYRVSPCGARMVTKGVALSLARTGCSKVFCLCSSI